VKDTFTFTDVPRESRILGLAGTLPYLGTSLSTVFLAWDLNKNIPSGNAFYDAIMIDHETAKHLLSVVEPIQLGYGAVIISFLGAIHWVSLQSLASQPCAIELIVLLTRVLSTPRSNLFANEHVSAMAWVSHHPL
jgi:hypothetical protein